LSGENVFLIELVLVAGIVVAFALRELWVLRRYRERDRERARRDSGDGG
jgi:hypothetical protein